MCAECLQYIRNPSHYFTVWITYNNCIKSSPYPYFGGT